MEKTELIKTYVGPATYQITVQGKVDRFFMRDFSGMQVIHTQTKEKELSTLTGKVMDQSALSGIINTLIDSRFSIISVMKIDE